MTSALLRPSPPTEAKHGNSSTSSFHFALVSRGQKTDGSWSEHQAPTFPRITVRPGNRLIMRITTVSDSHQRVKVGLLDLKDKSRSPRIRKGPQQSLQMLIQSVITLSMALS